MREVVMSSGRPLVYPLWLASPLLSGSPHQVAPLAFFTHYAIYSTVATHFGYPRSLYSTACNGALCRKTDPKIATVPKTQSRSKDQNKDKDNSK